jgi:arylsulfatase A-like enzyme
LPGINSPFRGGKYALYEGGVRVPAVAAWAGRIAPGSVVREPLHMVDWFPTLLGLAGAAAPPGLPLDGRDAWPTIAHGAPSPHDVILLNARPRNAALRAGDWKIVVQRAPRWRAGDSRVELFDLVRDPGETRDLSTTHPAQVKELEGRLAAFEKQAVPRLAERQPAGFRAPAVWGE